jgi:23S rRNA (cytosine1962-C5)-methyltransferase
MPALILKPGREKSLLRHHPWIFSGAVDLEKDAHSSGETVDVLSSTGQFLAQAAYSPHSQIRARIWTFEREEIVGEDLFRKRIKSSLWLRQKMGFFNKHLVEERQHACRLIHAESDGIPGLIVDQYADCLVVQFLSAGVEYWKDTLVDLLVTLTGIVNIYERSDVDVRQLEGLGSIRGPLRGDPSDHILIQEHDLKFNIDISKGHKTGFYLDQSMNRKVVRSHAMDCDVLDCFCYNGGFTLNSLAGGASSVLALDASAEALNMAGDNLELNDLSKENVEFMAGDVFETLRKFRDARRSFDLIILDPPKFAQTTGQVERAARGYKDINLLAFKLLRPGGTLITFSCSGVINLDLFQKIVAGSALDANVNARITGLLSQSPDHPVNLNFPEGAYLKGLVCFKD